MGTALSKELRSLLTYFGENPDSPEAPKLEDFFGLIASFSSSLQVCNSVPIYFTYSMRLQKCAVEVHDAEVKRKEAMALPAPNVNKSSMRNSTNAERTDGETLKAQGRAENSGNILLKGTVSGNSSIGRGDLDQAIRSMREGKRRNRPTRPLSKIYLDGGNVSRPISRFFEGSHI